MTWDKNKVKEIWMSINGYQDYPGYSEACKMLDYIIKSDGYSSFDELYAETIDENDTSAGGEYSTPNAFASTPKSDKDKEAEYKRIHATGTYSKKLEETLQKLVEVSYNDFKSDQTVTSKEKINLGIKNISKQLYEMERSVNQLTKLKTELGVDQTIFYKNTISKFSKINERLLKVTNKLREFSK
jgi:hypothetical protein